MSKLKAALQWAERGFRVFPLESNTKDVFIVKNWVEAASSDPEVIRSWWTCPVTGAEQDYNIGSLATGHIIADLDVKGGKRGLESFESLGLEMTTLTVRTPSGGIHCYYDGGECANAADLLGPGSGLDIRGFHGFSLAPGSSIGGIPYSIIVDDAIEMVPESLSDLLKPPRQRGRQALEFSDDSEEACAQGEHYLIYTAPIAIEGQGGNATTYGVCATLVRDYGLSEGAALELLLEHWNPRCEPPWSEEELSDLVEHASLYGTGEKGGKTSSAVFGDLEEIAEAIKVETEKALTLEGVDAPKLRKNRFECGNVVPDDELLARQWIYAPILMRQEVTQLVATGAGGKSSLALVLAIHGWLGISFMGHTLQDRPFKSIIYNAEDDIHEQTRRVKAICAEYEFDYQEVIKGLILICAKDFDPEFKLTKKDEKDPRALSVPNVANLAEIMRLGAPEEFGMIVLDPLVRIHEAEENSSADMTMVISALKIVAERANVGILLAHHTSKSGAKGDPSDPDSGRGSSAITTHCRVNLKLVGMTQEEATLLGIGEDERSRFSSLRDAKTNYSLRRGTPLWIKMHSCDVAGKNRFGERRTDSVGVPMAHNVMENAAEASLLMARVIESELTNAGTSTIALSNIFDLLKVGDPLLYGDLNAKTARSRAEAYLRRPVTTETGATIRIEKVGSTMTVIMG